MKFLKNIKKRGISLRALNMVMLVIAILISAVLFVAMSRTTKMYDETHEITQNLLSWRSNSYNLQVASDYLTEQMRSFVITGNREYLDNYFKEAQETRRREWALEDLKNLHGETLAYRDLNAAMQESVSLMNTEYHAARLAVEAYDLNVADFPEEVATYKLKADELSMEPSKQKEAAELLLFDDAYSREKAQITEHITNCLSDLSNEMNAEQAEISDKLKKQVVAEHALTVILIVIMLCIVLLTTRLVVNPLMRCGDMIRDEMDIPVKGVYEIRFLAKTYNLIHRTNLQSREQLTYEAMHDKLTGLYNRRGYDYIMKNVDLYTSALLLFDVDKFKQINDSLGHDCGDKALVRVTDMIIKSFRSQDYICRLGGDEIAVVMVHTDETLTKLLKKKIKKINDSLKEEKDGIPPFSVSAGMAFGEDGIDGEILFKRADEALYEAKNAGRSNVRIFGENV